MVGFHGAADVLVPSSLVVGAALIFWAFFSHVQPITFELRGRSVLFPAGVSAVGGKVEARSFSSTRSIINLSKKSGMPWLSLTACGIAPATKGETVNGALRLSGQRDYQG